jgi:hypothetical protein
MIRSRPAVPPLSPSPTTQVAIRRAGPSGHDPGSDRLSRDQSVGTISGSPGMVTSRSFPPVIEYTATAGRWTGEPAAIGRRR